MAKFLTKQFNRIALIVLGVLFFISSFFGVSGGVYAAAETEEGDSKSAIMQELGRLKIGGEKFDAANYPADEEGTPALLYLSELGYGYTADKQIAFGLNLYIFNPAQLNIVQDVRNTVQMKIGNAERYSKYALSVIDRSSDKLFYKLGVNFTAEEKKAVLAALDKESRIYEVSSLEFYLEGFNATSFDISPTRVFTYTGYAAGLGGNNDTNLESTLSYFEAGSTETIPLEVKHTSWRPKGTNGNSAWTQDTIHSVYFAVPKELDEQYDYLKSVQAQWIEARLAPVYITSNKDLAVDLARLYSYNLNAAIFDSADCSISELKSITYGGLAEYKCKPNEAFNWFLLTYPIQSSGMSWDGHYSLYFGYDEQYNSMKPYIDKRVNDLSLFVYTEDIAAGDYVVTSSELTELVQSRTEEIKDAFPYSSNLCYPVADKYPALLFQNWGVEHTTEVITVGEFDKNLKLHSEEVTTPWWNIVFGGNTVGNKQDYEDIKAIQSITDNDVNEKTPQELSDSLYISERDATDFISYYEEHKDDSTIYLMRFAVDEYWVQPTDEYKKSSQGTLNKKGVGYFAQETCYLDFDIIDFEYVKDDKSHVIPVSMSPIDIFPELTPPPRFYDFWPYGVGMMAALIVGYIVYKIAGKSARGKG